MNLIASHRNLGLEVIYPIVLLNEVSFIWKSIHRNYFEPFTYFSKRHYLITNNEYCNYSDQELLSFLNFNDDAAFEFIYRKYVKELFRYARRNISTKEDCEEIVQDIFLDIWKRRHNLHHVNSIKAYLISSVKYKIIRYIQHSKVKKKYAEHFKAYELFYDFQETKIDPSESLLSRLLDGISGLPLGCQEALKLRLLENLSNDEIAERMKISKKTVE